MDTLTPADAAAARQLLKLVLTDGDFETVYELSSQDAPTPTPTPTPVKTPPPQPPFAAANLLSIAMDTLVQRAAERGHQESERVMPHIVKTFNALTGNMLTVQEGYFFMVCLKLVRLAYATPRRKNRYKQLDELVDLAAYAALLGESMDEAILNLEPAP